VDRSAELCHVEFETPPRPAPLKRLHVVQCLLSELMLTRIQAEKLFWYLFEIEEFSLLYTEILVRPAELSRSPFLRFDARSVVGETVFH
jgi:hypothetical protein